MTEQFLTVNGLRLRIIEWGDPGLPSLFLLHGFSSTAVAWANVAETLAGRYHVVALDQRGHGARNGIREAVTVSTTSSLTHMT